MNRLVLRNIQINDGNSNQRSRTISYQQDHFHIMKMLNSDGESDLASDVEWNESDAWENSLELLSKPYLSSLIKNNIQKTSTSSLSEVLNPTIITNKYNTNKEENDEEINDAVDPLWEQIKIEAQNAVTFEPEAGPQIYQAILSQPSLLHALTQVICNEIESAHMPATSLRNLFFEILTPNDVWMIQMDVIAVSLRSASVGNAMMAVLFNKGLHALVCHRLSHQLWSQGRKSLACHMQSTISRKYSTDIHPAAKIGAGIYLNAGAGVIIGETVVIGDDVSILQGVTLGGTGKERGDRHPKVGNAVVLQDGATVLGNINIGDGAVITAKSIVTKPVPSLARVSGIPAKVKSYREKAIDSFNDKELRDSSDNYSIPVAVSSDDEDPKAKLKYKYFRSWEDASEPGKNKEYYNQNYIL